MPSPLLLFFKTIWPTGLSHPKLYARRLQALYELIAAKNSLETGYKKIFVADSISQFKNKCLKTRLTENVKEKVVKDILDIWEFVNVTNTNPLS